ncbi:gluconate 2-dehydrogenase subunit 3 family protein [Sphingomonas sp.]|uniref:gluconate 2-dehydrogenase subunit 3 family protein n=1 Tax=Sphingomonas sp. TaxID=28214 RepID=UPI00183C7AC3|nr:gluconate 2-dehydrogenase subunit 3 family protein [Sphingomonas sp.]MBA4761782.1 gluconate 2-dehydrogenase subunit 3 family protein [Sphingomonas sp.]
MIRASSPELGGLSRRRLLGAVGGGAVALALSGCGSEGDGVRKASVGFLDRLADLTIPATDTPGANAVGAGGFAERALVSGLFGGSAASVGMVEAALDKAGGVGFMRAPAERQALMLADLDRRVFADPRPQDAAAKAWRSVKQAIIYSYYTSEPGASVELRYELVPGRYDPDIPLKDGERYLSNNWMANLG